MKFKDAICSGVCLAVTFGGMAVFGAFAALWGHEIGKEDGKALAYADCTDRACDILENLKTNESEKEES